MKNIILGLDPLPWATRVQIAVDSARGLEYIHEHTVPLYIHRDVKSLNILIDKNFHAKVLCSCFLLILLYYFFPKKRKKICLLLVR